MPCSDSSSSIALRVDHDERFILFEFAKITCGREIVAKTGYNDYCRGRTLKEILDLSFQDAVKSLNLKEEEAQFVFFLEWDALRTVIVEYLGMDLDGIDRERCHITSIEYTEEGSEIALVILPPKELPKILPCSLAEN